MQQPPQDGAWFAQRRFGYGAGLPIAWQGWVVLGIYLAIAIGVPTWAPRWSAVTVIPATVVLIGVAYAKTRGGWRWRGWR